MHWKTYLEKKFGRLGGLGFIVAVLLQWIDWLIDHFIENVHNGKETVRRKLVFNFRLLSLFFNRIWRFKTRAFITLTTRASIRANSATSRANTRTRAVAATLSINNRAITEATTNHFCSWKSSVNFSSRPWNFEEKVTRFIQMSLKLSGGSREFFFKEQSFTSCAVIPRCII